VLRGRRDRQRKAHGGVVIVRREQVLRLGVVGAAAVLQDIAVGRMVVEVGAVEEGRSGGWREEGALACTVDEVDKRLCGSAAAAARVRGGYVEKVGVELDERVATLEDEVHVGA